MGGERINQRRFLFDVDARVPFSIIGVFIVLGSSLTTVYISQLELQKSQELARSLDFNEIEQLLYYCETDLTTALTIAGLKGLKEIGKNPVITPVIGTADEVNQYRVKAMIKAELSVYITGHYLDNMFSNGRYAINVVLHNQSPIPSLGNITLESLVMQMDRVTIPLIGPNETANYSTYWIASVPLTIEIRTLHGETWVLTSTRTVVISALLTSRYPLLESLIEDYAGSINGTFSSMWTMSTVLSNLYAMVRGFKHFRCGKPLNIVDNHHLAVMINSGLLLQQSLIFGSIDPLGLVELARKIKQVLKQFPNDALTTFNEEMNGDGYIVDTENLSEGSANVDAGSPLSEPIDQDISLNLTEIAERILLNITSVTFRFENEHGDFYDEDITYDGDVQKKLDEVVRRWASQSYYVTKVTKHLKINGTTLRTLQTIISEVYRGKMSTKVTNRDIVMEAWGDPGLGWSDGGVSPWEPLSVIPLVKQEIKPPKGQVRPGCSVYQEVYNVSYIREHYWWRIEQQTVNGSTFEVTVWNNLTDVLTETVTLHVMLEQYTAYRSYQNDIVDVLYVNETVDDQNLADTISVYLEMYPDAHPEKQSLITSRDNSSAIGLEAMVPGSYEDWVHEEAWSTLGDIHEMITEITLDPSINTTNYPNPSILLEKAKKDLQTQFNDHRSNYLSFPLYHPGEEFCSVGKKAVYCVRDWYVNQVQNNSENVFSQISTKISEALAAAIPDDAGFYTQNLTEILEDTSDALRNQFTIPFGYDMNLTRLNHTNVSLWNETVRLGVDHQPNYLDPYEKTQWGDEELWSLKIRNRCLFGPTGLPLLPPSPVTPWLLTINLWVIDIQGEYAEFKIIDTSDETIFNPFLGHEPQTFVREMKVISVSNTTLGENTRLSFEFTTVAFSIVPPYGMMVGDIQDNWFDDHTPGFRHGGEHD